MNMFFKNFLKALFSEEGSFYLIVLSAVTIVCTYGKQHTQSRFFLFMSAIGCILAIMLHKHMQEFFVDTGKDALRFNSAGLAKKGIKYWFIKKTKMPVPNLFYLLCALMMLISFIFCIDKFQIDPNDFLGTPAYIMLTAFVISCLCWVFNWRWYYDMGKRKILKDDS